MVTDDEIPKQDFNKLHFARNFSLGIKFTVPVLIALVSWLCYGHFIEKQFNIWLLIIIIALFFSTIGRCLFVCLSPFKFKEPRLKK